MKYIKHCTLVLIAFRVRNMKVLANIVMHLLYCVVNAPNTTPNTTPNTIPPYIHSITHFVLTYIRVRLKQ